MKGSKMERDMAKKFGRKLVKKKYQEKSMLDMMYMARDYYHDSGSDKQGAYVDHEDRFVANVLAGMCNARHNKLMKKK